MNYLYKDPADLTIHPALKHADRLEVNDPQMIVWRAGMERAGVDAHEIKITPEGKIVDGRHWWWNAKELQWDKVRVRVVASEEVEAVILETLLNRRHYTAGQRALVAYPHLKSRHEKAKAQNLEKLRSGGALPHGAATVATTEALAKHVGISRDTFNRAENVHAYLEKFAENKLKFSAETLRGAGLDPKKTYTLREVFWPQLMDREAPLSLNRALPAITSVLEANRIGDYSKRGDKHTGGKPQEASKQLKLFAEAFDTLATRYEYWKKFDEDGKRQAGEAITESLREAPDDYLDTLHTRVNAELRRRKKEAQS